jgi:dimethylargininase
MGRSALGHRVIAIVRRPSDRVAEGEVTHLDRTPLDVELAFQQHAAYVELLAQHGFEIVWAPELPDHPDGLFVEDALVVIDGQALLTRPGALSRRTEVESLVALTESLALPTTRLIEPGTLDGGDVLVTDRHVFVGRTSRTNDDGIEQLRAFAATTGRTTIATTVNQCLHLKSAITALPDGTLQAVRGWVDASVFTAAGYNVRFTHEVSGGDVLCLGQTVVLAADAPETAAALRRNGFVVETVDVGELQKIEAGVTCMSVLV